MQQISIINRSGHALPSYASAGASGLDLRAVLAQPRVLAPMERALIPTGLYLEIPQGMEAQVRPRSGLALKQGITCLNSPGTIDADYRGQLQVLLINLSTEEVSIAHGDRIAQLVFQKVEIIQWRPVEILGTTQRQEGGFGHTGLQ